MTNPQSGHSDYQRFVARLAQLDPGALAILRRKAGQTLAEATSTYPVFFRVLPTGVTYAAQQERYFLIATLYALTTRRSDSEERGEGVPLGQALHALRRAQLAATGRADTATISLDRRVAALLDADVEQLPFRLRQLVRLLHSHDQRLNWVHLLADVLRWDHPDHYVQRRLARDYYLGTTIDPLKTTKEPVA